MIRRCVLVLFGFALGLYVSAWKSSAQVPLDFGGECTPGNCGPQESVPIVHFVAPDTHPPIFDFTVADIVDILADFTLVHQSPLQPDGPAPYYGFTDFGSQTIVLSGRMDRSYKRSTLLHELIHIKSRSLAVDLDEDSVAALEALLYRKHFGLN